MKRWICTLLSLVLILSLAKFPAKAEETAQVSDFPVEMNTPQRIVKTKTIPIRQGAMPDLTEFTAYFLEQVKTCPGMIDISHFAFPKSSALKLYLQSHIWYETPEAFHVYGIGILDDGQIFEAIYLTYNSYADTPEEYAQCLEQMHSGAEFLLEGVEGNEELTDLEKALLLHDRLAVWVAYAYEDYLAGTLADTAYCAYGALGQRKAVCQGYAMAYMYLLGRVGIEADYCSSDLLWHGWNIVYLDGQRYHVDVTWDDPVWDVQGRVYHNNFLLSTEGMISSGHHKNGVADYDTSPVDTTYDHYYWQDASAAFQYVAGEFYYTLQTDGNLYCTSDVTENQLDPVVVTNLRDQWFPEFYYTSRTNYARLIAAGGKLFFSQARTIKQYDPATNEITVFWEVDDPDSCVSIAGFSYEPGCFLIETNKLPYSDGTGIFTRVAYTPECAVHSFTNYISNGDATYEADGTKTAKCDYCDATDTIPDPGSKLEPTVAMILEQPVSVAVDSGNNASFSVAVQGDVVSYKWEYRKIYKWFETSLEGYSTDTLIVPAVGSRNGYAYRCTVTFADGTVLVSDAAKLTVHTEISNVQNPNDQTVVLGYKGQFTASAVGEGLQYQWEYKRPEGNLWIDTAMEGANKSTVMIESAASRDGYQYRCRITDVTGKTVYTEPATMRVLSIKDQPQEAFASVGSKAQFTIVTSVTDGFTYQWQYSRNSGATWFDTTMAGYNTATLTVDATLSRNGYLYRCVLTGSKSSQIVSEAALLHAARPVEITKQPVSAAAAVGTTVTFHVTATNAHTYQWEYARKNSTTWWNTNMTGNTTDTLYVDVVTGRDGYRYRCRITGLDGKTYYTNIVTLTVG